MYSLLKLIRIQNLLLIILLQYFLRYYFVGPMLASFGLEFALSGFDFALVVLMTVCIASAGYIINDYFDLRMDYINRPGSVIVGRDVKRRMAMFLHVGLSAVGILIGLYISYKIQVWVAALIPLLTVGLLWFYSTEYKRQFLIGNIIISLLGIFPVFFIMIFEPAVLRAYFNPEYHNVAVLIFKVTGYFAVIAFGINLLYALIKDLHDKPGDEVLNCRTLPIVAGEISSKITFTIISIMLVFALFYIQNMQYLNNAYVPLIYILFGIQIPLLIVNVLLYLRDDIKSYNFLRKTVGILMIIGVFAIPVLYFFPGS